MLELERGLAPIDQRFFLADLRRIRRTLCGLRTRRQRSSDHPIQGFDHRLGTHLRQAVMQRARRVGTRDGGRFLEQHRARIETRVHLHDGHAGLRIACEQRAMDRRGSAPARQQRSMDVDATHRRHGQHRGREYQTVGDDDHHIGSVRLKMVDRTRLTQGRWLFDREPMSQRRLLDRAHRELLAATGGTIRLCVDGNDAVTRSHQGFERRHRKLRRAGENDRKGTHASGVCARSGALESPTCRTHRSL